MICNTLFRPALANALAATLVAASLSAQDPERYRTEQVSYWNVHDSTLLSASLAVPPGAGPHPGVVVLSIAGTEPLVDDLVGDGYAVLTPVRRGFVAVEPLLRATYSDLAADALAALGYLGSRTDVDEEELGLVAQADDTPPAMLAAAAAEASLPLVLLAPPALPGTETFRREQRWVAEGSGAGRTDLEALDRYAGRIAEIVLGESTPYLRESRLRSLREESSVQLPRNAAFPSDERQMHFFASPLWRDRLAFEPEAALARLRWPVLVLIGVEDPNTPLDAYLPAVRRGLSEAGTPDATACLLPGRTRHTFTEAGVAAVAEWLGERVVDPGETRARTGGGLSGCLPDPGR